MNLLALRDKFWNYPYFLLFGRKSLAGQAKVFYLDTRPFSHAAFTIIAATLIIAIGSSQLEVILGFNQNTFVEGVIVGATPSGEPRGPSRLNPLQVVVPQLDKDVMELVYEPLIRVNQKGQVIPVLAEDYSGEKVGISYRFSLKKGVYWHDGKPFTTRDVKATFDLIKELGSADVPNVYSGAAAKNIELEILDDYICRFSVKEGLLPNLSEVLTFKIVPAHMIDQYKDAFTKLTDTENLVTIGTGPYKLNNIETSEVNLNANKQYHGGEPSISKFEFKLLRDEEEAVNAIKSGQVHALVNLNSDIITSVSDNPNYEVKFSVPIYTQYWGIYFNLSESGSKLFKDKSVRRVFSYAINRDLAIKSSIENAEAAYGTIPRTSRYYNEDHQQPGYNRQRALSILRDKGWKLLEINDPITGKIVQVQTKDKERLEFNLAFVDNPDRKKLVDSIKADLSAIGIIVRLQALQPQQLVNVRLNQDFDLLLFGVSTFVDPDRFEFFNSTQTVAKNGLNISGYSSTETKTIIDEVKRRAVTKPYADVLLDDGRKLSLYRDRKEKYDEFQRILSDDVPVIFLYHPTVRYLVSQRITNVNLNDVRFLEDRLHGVQDWEIVYN